MDTHWQKYTILTRKNALRAVSGTKCLNRAQIDRIITISGKTLLNFGGFSIDICPQTRYSKCKPKTDPEPKGRY